MSNLALVALLTGALLPAAPPSGARLLSRAEILAAMRTCEGYDLTATTNGARFQAEVLLHLLRAEQVARRGIPLRRS